MNPESLGDRQDALTVRLRDSDSVHFVRRERCSGASPWVRYHPRLRLSRQRLLARDAPFRLLPRRTELLQATLGVRFESSQLHQSIVLRRLIGVVWHSVEWYQFPGLYGECVAWSLLAHVGDVQVDWSAAGDGLVNVVGGGVALFGCPADD